MTTTFRRSARLGRGYSVDQVEDFFTRARQAYEQNALRTTLSSSDVRSVGFDLVLHGYDVAQVDAALDRMEDAFARREQEVLRGRIGADRALGQLAARAATLKGRLARPDGDRFDREVGLELAYDPDDVDDLCHRLLAFFEEGAPLPVEEIRGAVFGTRRGRRGYVEVQVDAFLDRAVEVLTSVD